MNEQHPAEVFDISPLACPRCHAQVAEEDAFCSGCGLDLLEGLPRLCGVCGRALATGAAFCPGCGTELMVQEGPTGLEIPTVVTAGEVSFSSSEQEIAPARSTWLRRHWWKVLIGALITAIAAFAVWWGVLRTDFSSFDTGLKEAAAIAGETQEASDAIANPGDLDDFAATITDMKDDISLVQAAADGADGGDLRAALGSVIEAEDAYLQELIRLAELPSAQAAPEEYKRVGELRDNLLQAFTAATALHGQVDFDVPELSTATLTGSLADLAAYRKQVIAQRAEVKQKNQARAEELSQTEIFTSQFDGIAGRYSDARTELQDWLDGVRSNGASFIEGYQVLQENVDLRTQIRSEVAVLAAPEAFAADVQSLMAVMDDAIAATDAAIRGLDEYIYGFEYLSVFDTPGWSDFQIATERISDDYASVLAGYEGHKAAELERLSKRIPLPELPE